MDYSEEKGKANEGVQTLQKRRKERTRLYETTGDVQGVRSIHLGLISFGRKIDVYRRWERIAIWRYTLGDLWLCR